MPDKIYAMVLDALTDALKSDDPDKGADYLAVPFRLDMLDRTHVSTSREGNKELLRAQRARLESLGVTSLKRTTESARYVTPEKIEGYHITTPLKFGVPAVEPYAIQSTLELQDGRWVSTGQKIILRDADWKLNPNPEVMAPCGAALPGTEDTDAQALEIYSTFLAEVCALFESDQFEACLPYFALPHTMNTVDRVLVCKTPSDMLHALATYAETMKTRQVKKMYREVVRAQFLAADRLDGFHLSHALREDAPVIPPFLTRNRLVLTEGRWRSAEQTGIVENKDWHIVPRPVGADQSKIH